MIFNEFDTDEGTSSESFHRECTITFLSGKAVVSLRPVKESSNVDPLKRERDLSSFSNLKRSGKRLLSDLFLPVG